jgi:hypothetical protein
MSISIGMPTPLRHTQSARNSRHFGIKLSQPSPGWKGSDDALTPVAGSFRQRLRVCHHGLTALALVNPALPTPEAVRPPPISCLEYPCQEPEAEHSLVKPACSLASRAFGAIKAPYHAVASSQAPRATTAPCRRNATLALTCKPFSSSTWGSRGPSLARSFAEQKASQSLPALAAPAPSRGGRRPRGDRPEVCIRSACAFDPRQPLGWALLEARQGHRLTDPAPDAGSRSRHR